MEQVDKKSYMFTNRDLKRLIVPMLIEQLLAILVGLCDSLMVASVGEHAVSGVSLVDTIIVLLIHLFGALATGGAVVAGQYLGQNNRQKACRATDQLVLFTAISAVIITGGIYIAKDFILLNVFGKIESNVMESAKTYLLYVAASIPFIALYNAGAAIFRSMGNSKVPMYLSLLMNAVNVGGNAVLIYGFAMGVKGAAIATLASRIIAALGIILLLRGQEHTLHLSRPFSFRLDKELLKKIAFIGIPNGFESSMFQLGKILVLSLVTTFGTAAIAANAVGNIIGTFQIMPGMAVSMALITVVSRCVGARDYEMARYYTQKILKLTHFLIFIFNFVILLVLPGILALYQLSPEATGLATQISWLHGICAILIWPESFSLANTLRAANDVKYCMVWSIFSMWVFRIAFSYILGVHFEMGLFGVWVSMIIDWCVRSAFFITRYRGTKWQGHKI
ncbi:MATE family efflux transporter [Anaerotignum sp. MB30-C6]|uniref:MATE family efflux transporter n=1 Tax=Anaerotignum sp. MB30-C6 TaxID=3070814 RepID=UPI0027DE58EF|nr:MATE family efflux transporter [Anaerotignum sp. MB30-C6]WMI81329.1 MATE family efflux transporter [Anaerotignum sp. MB30-C6]